MPVERLLFQGDIVKIGRFDCPSNHACFARTSPLNNNLFVVTHEALWWRRDEGDFRFAGPGTALLHRQGRQVERREVVIRGDLSDWYAIRQDLFEETLQRYRLDEQDVTERTRSWVTSPAFRFQESQLVSRLQNNDVTALEIEETSLMLFEQVCQGLSSHQPEHSSSNTTTIRRQRLVDRTRFLLDSLDYETDADDQSLGLNDIAQMVGASAYHLCRVFRAECGMSLHAYRLGQKLGRALKMMRSGRQDLTVLAQDLGFSSHSHFTRVFRQHMGDVPSRFNSV